MPFHKTIFAAIALAAGVLADWEVNVYDAHEGCTGTPAQPLNAGYTMEVCNPGNFVGPPGDYTNVDFMLVENGRGLGEGLFSLNLYAGFDESTLECSDFIGSFTEPQCLSIPVNGQLVAAYSISCVHGQNATTSECNAP